MKNVSALCLALLLAAAESSKADFDKFEFQKPFPTKKAAAKTTAAPAKRKSRTTGPGYEGKLGFSLSLSGKKSGLRTASEMEEGHEIVFILPAGLELEKAKAAEPGQYAKLGLIKLEVMNISDLEVSERKDPIKALRSRLQEGFDLAEEKATESPLTGTEMKGVALIVTGKNARTHVILQGERLMFSFMTGKIDGKLKNIIRSLQENEAP